MIRLLAYWSLAAIGVGVVLSRIFGKIPYHSEESLRLSSDEVLKYLSPVTEEWRQNHLYQSGKQP